MTSPNDQDPDQNTPTPKPSDLLRKSADPIDPSEFLPAIATPRKVVALTRADQAFEMRLAGMSYRKIAAALGITEKSVYEAVRVRLRRAAKHMAESTAPDLLLQELERLDELYAVAHARAVGGPILDDDGEPITDAKGRQRYYEADHRWAGRAQELLKTRAELLGLVKTQIEITGANGGPVESRSVSVDLSNMTPAQIAAFEILLGRMGVQIPGLTPAPALLPETIDAEVNDDADS